jgi:hypothetical protein
VILQPYAFIAKTRLAAQECWVKILLGETMTQQIDLQKEKAFLPCGI